MIERSAERWLWQGYFNFEESDPADFPPVFPDTLKVYAKDVGGVSTLCYMNDQQVEICLTAIPDAFSCADLAACSLADLGTRDHGALTGLGDDDHPQYRLESADHNHQTTGAEAGKLDHGLALDGLADDDHTQYVLRSILTTNGDLFVRLAGVIARLGVGSEGDVLTVTAGLPAWAPASASGGSAWSVLSNGDPVTPELMWDSNGDVIMTELCGGAICS